MSKSNQKSSLIGAENPSSKNLIIRAVRTVPNFEKHLSKFEQQVTLQGYAKSTLFNYARSVAKISLHFGKSPLELDPEEINTYLFGLHKNDRPSDSCFKHMVYGLRFFFRLYNLEDRAIQLPPLRNKFTLPVVLSRKELKALFAAPERQKQRVLFALIYSAGLRVSELCKLKIADIDSDRMRIKITQSKGNKDRYVILSHYILKGLRKYFQSCKPKVYLFNGRLKGTPLGHGAVQTSFRLAVKKSGIRKKVTLHSLRHSYATHLLEEGVDIVTIKELLGHSDIGTTMIYLHVAKVGKVNAHSPLDSLYYRDEAQA